ncbi:hypothetical protein [Burkholderia ubonensis]|uniref:hypothetical protein n=1 Tax=Burkholderia ubonensis TaxID=101571 RepID=UPI001452D05E|nr:hypothetical protein [Burkholderia ubonensis]VWB58923.1 hypothetical protein BUB20358_02715 [Burkholderia ubonensis]
MHEPASVKPSRTDAAAAHGERIRERTKGKRARKQGLLHRVATDQAKAVEVIQDVFRSA